MPKCLRGQLANPVQTLLFAEDMVSYVVHSCSGKKLPEGRGAGRLRDTMLPSRFTPHMGEAVLHLIQENMQSIQNGYLKLRSDGVNSSEEFNKEAVITVVNVFNEGYDHFKFLQACALLIGMSVFYFLDGYRDIPAAAAAIIAYIVNFYIYHLEFKPFSSWFELAVQAQVVRRNFAVHGKTTMVPAEEPAQKIDISF